MKNPMTSSAWPLLAAALLLSLTATAGAADDNRAAYR